MKVNGFEIYAEKDQSVISGTLRPQDLIPVFLHVIKDTPEYRSFCFNNPEVIEVMGIEDDPRWESEEVFDFLNERLMDIMDIMEKYAPDGYYFGSHPGNGSDFGYWNEQLLD